MLNPCLNKTNKNYLPPSRNDIVLTDGMNDMGYLDTVYGESKTQLNKNSLITHISIKHKIIILIIDSLESKSIGVYILT